MLRVWESMISFAPFGGNPIRSTEGYVPVCLCMFSNSGTRDGLAARALFQVTFLGDCWVPSPGGRELTGGEEAEVWGSLVLYLPTHSSLLCTRSPAENELFG